MPTKSDSVLNLLAAATEPRDGESVTFTAPVSFQASGLGADGKAVPPTFSMTAYTGGAMDLRGWKFPVVVDQAGFEDLSRSRPVLRDHDTTLVLGHTTNTAVQAGSLVASGVVSGHGEHVTEIVNSSDRGFPWQASMGAKVLKNQFVPEGETAQANGRTWQGPVNIARRTSLGEISFVALGADDNTSARIAAEAAKVSVMKKKFAAWLRARGFKIAEMDEGSITAAKALYKIQAKADADDPADVDDDGKDEPEKQDPPSVTATAVTNPAPGAPVVTPPSAEDPVKQVRAAYATESKRVAAIRKACRGQHAEIEAKAIEEGWDETKAELEVLRAERPRPGTANGAFGINVGAGVEITTEILAASAAVSGGIAEKYAYEGMSDKAKEIAASKPLRRQSIFGLCAIVASANGVHLPAARMNDDVIRAMLRIEQQQEMRIQAAGDGGGFSTVSLSSITENVLNKAMLQSYGTVDSIVEQFIYETSANDFKPIRRYRLTASGDMLPVGPDGELKSMSLQDEGYTNQLSTIGAILMLTRQLLINDDMGAIVQLPQIIGRRAAISRERAVISTLIGNANSFFSTGNKNIMTGAGSVLSIDSLATARKKFVEQKDVNGDPIMVMPSLLLVPPALETTADNLFQGANLIVTALGTQAQTSSSTPAQGRAIEPNVNAHRGKYTPVVSPYLGAASPLPGGSDTAWWLLGDPAGGFSPIQIAYLRGQRTPIIERGEPDFNKLGIGMRAYWDFGVAQLDFRSAVYSAGA